MCILLHIAGSSTLVNTFIYPVVYVLLLFRDIFVTNIQYVFRNTPELNEYIINVNSEMFAS